MQLIRGSPILMPDIFTQARRCEVRSRRRTNKRFTIFSQWCDNWRDHWPTLPAMKSLFASAVAFLVLAVSPLHAASDADVTIIKASQVVIGDNVITIVAEAKTRITLIQAGHDPANKGDRWMGRPVSRVMIKSDKATFTIQRPKEAALEQAWKESLRAAKDLQEGREVGRIGFYAPEMVIKGNLLVSATGPGFLYAKGG